MKIAWETWKSGEKYHNPHSLYSFLKFIDHHGSIFLGNSIMVKKKDRAREPGLNPLRNELKHHPTKRADPQHHPLSPWTYQLSWYYFYYMTPQDAPSLQVIFKWLNALLRGMIHQAKPCKMTN